ncbi:DEP domain-containing protein 1A-like [Styela clava]|uniref:DEP domain-containing protein 1A-like n=1 Tax=Styela clava TaxID=7725 RepID=UPI00193951EF|nr:DEP domain-containing protein 1A-like [Styela clava]
MDFYSTYHASRSDHKMIPRQYKATAIWNELIGSFRIHMCCKTRRRNLKTYSNCFTGAGAIHVLHAVLIENQNFTRKVTREQAHKLMQKFLSEHVIETVNGKWENETFSDSNRLYRFNKEYACATPSLSSRCKVMSPPTIKRFSTNILEEKERHTDHEQSTKKTNLTRKDDIRLIPSCIMAVTD